MNDRIPGTSDNPNRANVSFSPAELLPILPGHSSPGRFERVLRAGRFAVTTELAPPDSADPAQVFERASVFDGYVDAINATDGSGANCHMSSVAVCGLLTRAGYSPIMQISCRDRNRIAIQGEVLGASAMGVSNILCLTGDGVQAGDHPQAKPVFDLDCISLLEMAANMRDHGTFQSGRKLDVPPSIFLGAAANPFAPPLDWRPHRLAKKIAVGAQFVQTQYCFDIDLLKQYLQRVCDMGLHEHVYILVGVGTLASARTARWIRDNVPGVHIPDAIITRLEGADDQRAEGINICIELIQQCRELKGVSGCHIMAYRQEQHVPDIIRRSGILDERRAAANRRRLASQKAG
jgi:methylenetetrahydrofolate reductase (NADPH)